MKISFNWLKKYVDINIPSDELINRLIGTGFDLESVENQADTLKNFVIGKVLDRAKHPNADKLSLCKVDAGQNEILSIVCGAPNVVAGQTVCVALIGAVVPNGGFEIKKSKIRGEFSEGMICSARELNLGDDHTGIMVLNTQLKPGTPFAEYLGQDDVVIDIGVTPNRGDLLSHIGAAREAAFVMGVSIHEPEIKSMFIGREIDKHIKVEIENPDACYRYCGTLIKGIKVAESPKWLKDCIKSVGLRPINNVVDITNFVMFECGQPLHAFDYNMIGGKKIVVKNAKAGQKFTTLDSKERTLNENILMICDAQKPVALAGIMGGENSEISDSTTDVFIESACFDPVITRRSSKFVGLQTDSSYRFERGIDIDKTYWAALRAAELIAEFAGGKIVEGVIDNYPNKKEKARIPLRTSYLNKLTGIEFTLEQAKELLAGIGIKCIKIEKETAFYEIPAFRSEDIRREVDLIEEVLRLFGYSGITDPEYLTMTYDIKKYDNDNFDTRNILRNHFVSKGFKEIISNSMLDINYVTLLQDRFLRLRNPSSVLMNTLRADLIVGPLSVVNYNLNRQMTSLKLFEFGNVFVLDDNQKLEESSRKMLLMAGKFDSLEIGSKERDFDVFDMKGQIEALLSKMNIENYDLNDYYYGEYYDSKFEYIVEKKLFAVIYVFSKSFLKKFEIDKPVIICEIF